MTRAVPPRQAAARRPPPAPSSRRGTWPRDGSAPGRETRRRRSAQGGASHRAGQLGARGTRRA
eukprot:881977-Lingulodinium_polyedra.AAC.1